MEKRQEDKNTANMLQALEYAKLGWKLIPIHTAQEGNCSCLNPTCNSPGKHPRTRHGSKDASNDPVTICRWWSQWPDANIGIATGSSSNLVVIDIDPRHGGDQSWEKFQLQHQFATSLTSVTGGGGLHIYYFTGDKTISNKTNILPGVDVRGEGGYVIAPPSTHSSGDIYDWKEGLEPELIKPLPKAIEDLIFNRPSNVIPIKGSHIPNGSRNSTLTSLAGLLRRKGLEESGIVTALGAFNQTMCHPPLEVSEVATIAKSIAKYQSPDEQTDIDWPEPKDLPDIRVPVPNLSESYLPETVRTWVADIAERMQIPLEFVAAPVLVSMSSVIGRQIGIYPKQQDDWLVVPNLWGSVIARPGYFKSPAIAESMKPLEGLVAKARSKYESEAIIAKSKEDMIKAQIEGIKDNIKKCVRKGNQHEIDHLRSELEHAIRSLEELNVTEKRYKTNDATIEKIGALLLENPNGLLLLRDELSGWLKGMQKSGREGDREFFLEAWNGYGSYTVDRISRGTLHIPSLCLSIFGGLQPGKLDSYVQQTINEGAGDDGLLQRFQMLVFPDTSAKWKNIDRKPNMKAYEQACELYAKLASIKVSSYDIPLNQNRVPGLRFDDDAQEIFNSWRCELERRLRSGEIGSPAFESHLSKYRSLVPSLALIFHLGSASDFSKSKIQSSSVELAIKWATFLEVHAKKVYSHALYPEVKAAHALAAKIKAGQVKDKQNIRTIYRRNWSLLDGSHKLDGAISVLEDCHWISTQQIKTSHAIKEIIRINPKLKL
ncbi:MAG: DUF3987 domain-containing protein [Oligoflexus sp.]